MLKKLLMAAMMAMALTAFFASAAQANKALTVLKGGKALTETTEIELSGPAKFTGSLGGIEATLDAKLHIPANNTGTGTITTVTVTNPKPFGLIGGCTLTSSAATGLPWTVHAEETTGGTPVKTIDITNPQFKNTLSGGIFCPAELNITGGTVIATPNNAGAISSVTLSGTVTTTAGNATASGTLNVVAPHTGVLGIG